MHICVYDRGLGIPADLATMVFTSAEALVPHRRRWCDEPMSLPDLRPADALTADRRRTETLRRITQAPSATDRWTGRCELRVGDAERSAACDALSVHFAEGRLTADELDSRLTAATTATTLSDLQTLLIDLPDENRAERRPTPVRSVGPSVSDILIAVGIVGSVLIVLVMLTGIGFYSPPLFLASVFGGFLALGVGAGLTHLVHRHLHRRT